MHAITHSPKRRRRRRGLPAGPGRLGRPGFQPGEKLSIFLFAAAVLAVVVGGAFAAGYLIGRILL
jgi:hypothetical protein